MQITEGIKEEREILQTLRDKADSIIDTSNMKPRDLKEEVSRLYIEGEDNPKLTISVVSFGFKHGIPIDADLVFDVRFLPNPYYLEELRPKTGDDQDVRDYVMDSDVSREFLTKLEDMIDFLIPQYIKEGKNHLVIAIGCTGGRHRSVTISNLMYDNLIKKGYRAVKRHRDYTLR
ncbi:P-loop ATPase family protein [[Clostridium] sordellii ATCC 9714]|nr:P-loop ATPase family protein [[Clostridium] sordellii ATCC 9714] [Paeniclostridium sordellii ATCC 9714]